MGLFGNKNGLKPFSMKKAQVLEVAALSQSALEQWLGFKRFFLKSFTQEPIETEDETAFLEVKSQIARSLRSLSERINEREFYFGGDKAGTLMRQAVSVAHLRSLPAADRRTLYKDWHTIFVHLSRTVGAFKFLSEGYVPPPRKPVGVAGAPQGGGIAAIMKAGSHAGKK